MAKKNVERDLCREQIQESGLRATASRIAVLELLRVAKSAMSHAEVVRSFEEGIWDRATLYRNLVDMTESGILRRIELGDHTWRFEAISVDGKEGHPHFVCLECGTVECLPSLELLCKGRQKMPRSVRKQAVEVSLRGLCDGCA